MSKSSRLWWLHGMVLAAAVVGCKSNSGGVPSGAMQSGPPPMTGGPTFMGTPTGPMGTPTGAGSTTTYPVPSGTTTTYPGMSGGQTFTPPASSGFTNSASPMYSQPGMATSGGPSFGSH
jgi:hypothetical protein